MHASKRKALIAAFPAKREYLHGQPVMPLANKVAVLGMLERGADGTSRVRTMPVQGTKRHELQGKIREHVEEGSALYTDSLRSYRNMNDYQHSVAFFHAAHHSVSRLSCRTAAPPRPGPGHPRRGRQTAAATP